jgi:hypothetical protein
MKKEKFNQWLIRNDIGKAEFVVYCAMGAMVFLWVVAKLLNL